MLDFQIAPKQISQRNQDAPHEIPVLLLEAMSNLSTQELDDLEDELDFFAFTGLKGPGIRRLEAHL